VTLLLTTAGTVVHVGQNERVGCIWIGIDKNRRSSSHCRSTNKRRVKAGKQTAAKNGIVCHGLIPCASVFVINTANQAIADDDLAAIVHGSVEHRREFKRAEVGNAIGCGGGRKDSIISIVMASS